MSPIGADEARALFTCLEGVGRVALAVSGGRDSMALVRLVHRWAGEVGRRPAIVALTVDHQLRAEATAEARRVADWCEALGIDHAVLEWTGAKPATRIQERARAARYGLMTAWCAANGANALAVAHHQEDQAETVIMRLARASGVDGLAGMAGEGAWNGVAIFRPLLSLPRSRLTATLQALGQPWIDDPTNADPAYERTRLREQWPALEACGLSASAIAACAAKLKRAAEALDVVAARVMVEAVAVEPAGFARIDRQRLLSEPEEIRRRVVGKALDVVAGGGVADASLTRATECIMQIPTRGFTLAGCRIADAGDSVLIARESRSLPRDPLRPGDTVVWDDRFAVSLGADLEAVEIRALGPEDFAAARALKATLASVPKIAGSALPGGYVDGALLHVPDIGARGGRSGLVARFLREPLRHEQS